MILLRLISWPDARKHVLRSLLTVAGIILGIAVFVGMHTANRSVLAGFNQTVDRIAGKTQLQVSAGEAGFGEDVLERIQSVPEVRVAVPVIEAVVDTGRKGQGNLLILAVDMTGDSSLRDYQVGAGEDSPVEDPLVFLAQPDSLIVSRDFAARNKMKTGDALPMRTMDGEKRFTVRGIVQSGGLASAFGGNLAVMDIYAAQKVFGRGRKFDRIDLAVNEGVTVQQCQTALRKLLGPGFAVEPPSSRGQQFESMLRVYSLSMDVSSLFALLIGMFIIYNSLLIAVTQRRTEIGILRALGATRGQIQMLFVGEAAVAGLLGSTLGVVAGLFIAKGLAGHISGIIETLYGSAERTNEISVDPKLALFAAGLGVAASVVSALLPARNASAVDPAVALQKGHSQAIGESENRIRRNIAIAMGAVSLACLAVGGSALFFYGGYLLMALSALLLTPMLALWLAKAMRPLLSWLQPVEGPLAVESIILAPRRTSATVAALMLSLAMTIGLGGLAQSTYSSVREWLDATFNAPLFVTTSQSGASQFYHFPAAMLPSLTAIEGVEEAQPVRHLKLNLAGKAALLVATDLTRFAARTPNRRIAAGSYQKMYEAAAQGKGLIVSENFAERHGLSLASDLELPTPSGLLRLPVAGIVKDYSFQEGTIFIDRPVYMRNWNDDSIDMFRVYLKNGVAPDDVKRRIIERFERERHLFVLSNQELKSYVLHLADQWFAMTYVQIAVAVLVSVLGILNTLTVSITERKRELAVMRAVGGLASQVRRTIWLEAFTIAVIGLVLGLALGAVHLYYQLDMIRRDFTGMALEYQFPLSMALALVPVILISAWVSALGPAELAVRTPLVEALEYE